MKVLLLFALGLSAFAQQTIRFSATTGDVSLSSAATAATLQQPSSNASQVIIDQIVVRCSVACVISQAAGGAAATATAGTVTAILPGQLGVAVPVNFFTASNVGGGTAQGGSITMEGAGTVVFCLSKACGNAMDVSLATSGTKSNYTASIAAITGTVNITFYGRSIS